MLTYHYALISNPCERTLRDLLDYVRACPGCLNILEPDDLRAIQRAIANASRTYDDEYAVEAEEFMLGLDQRIFH